MTMVTMFDKELEHQRRVQEWVAKIEEEHSVQIIYCVEGGSRLWRMESKDSDYDIRFVYVHHGDWYLSIVDPKPDTIIAFDGDMDFHGWEVRKAMQLCYKSNPTFYEWLASDIVYVGTCGETLVSLGKRYLNLNVLYHAYRGLAKSTWMKYFTDNSLAITKKYFYVLRPLLCTLYISQHNSPPPMNIYTLVGGVNIPVPIKTAIISLLAEKKAGSEMGMSQRLRGIDGFITAVLGNLDAVAPPPTVKLDPARVEPLNSFVRQRVLMATREISARKPS